MTVTVTETKSGSSVNAKIIGTIAEVDAEVKVYFDNYNPCGYQTSIVNTVVDDDIKSVYIARWNNCD
jgi:hypothetical protein